MKKFLSLVLALVMTMSLVTISAGATEYKDLTDKDDLGIQYQEAVAVLNKIGVITGYDDGSFRPDVELTRGAAAKIIVSMLLGPEAASNLPNNSAPYPDVPANHTFAGVISYCKNSKIINGYSDGTFKPSDTLTGFAFAKMLLGALGYDNSIEGLSGAGWTMNVASLGQDATLFDRIDFKGGDPVTRKDAALLALNTLKATVVEYKGGSTITAGDATVVTNPVRGYKTSNQDYARNILPQRRNINESVTSRDDYNTVEFAEEHFVDLRLPHDKYSPTRDEYGRPSAEWSYKKLSIGTFPLEPDFEYTTQVIHAGKSIDTTTDAAKVRALGLNGYNVVDGSKRANLWINGVEQDGNGGTDPVLGKTAEIADYTDNGTQVLVYVDNNGADFITDVVVIKTQMMEVRRVGSDYVSLDLYKDHSDADGKILYGYNDEPIDVAVNNVETGDDYFEFLSGLKVGDLVAVEPVAVDHNVSNKRDYDVGHAYTPETVSGALTNVETYGNVDKDRNAVNLTVGGTKYPIALWNRDLHSIDPNTVRVTTKDVTLHMDKYGNAMVAKDIGATKDWMVIGNYRQSIVNGILVTFANGWDIDGKAVSLNIGAHNTNMGGTQGNWNGDLPPVGSLVYYTNSLNSNTAEWDLHWKTEQTKPAGTTAAWNDGNQYGVFDVYVDKNSVTDDYDLGVNSQRIQLNNYGPTAGTTNDLAYRDSGIKFIYITMDESGEVDSIEVKSGMQRTSNAELRGTGSRFEKYNIAQAQACVALKSGKVTADSGVKAVVIKSESNAVSLRNLLYITNTNGEIRREDGVVYQKYEVAMFNESGKLENDRHIEIWSDRLNLAIGSFARYTKVDNASFDNFYSLRPYGANAFETHDRSVAVARTNLAHTGAAFVGANNNLIRLDGTYAQSVARSTVYAIETYHTRDHNIINGEQEEFAYNLVDFRGAEFIDMTGKNWDIENVDDLKDAYLKSFDFSPLNANQHRDINVTLLFNDNPDNDGFRQVYLVIVNSVSAAHNNTSASTDIPATVEFKGNAVKGTDYTVDKDSGLKVGDVITFTLKDGVTIDADSSKNVTVDGNKVTITASPAEIVVNTKSSGASGSFKSTNNLPVSYKLAVNPATGDTYGTATVTWPEWVASGVTANTGKMGAFMNGVMIAESAAAVNFNRNGAEATTTASFSFSGIAVDGTDITLGESATTPITVSAVNVRFLGTDAEKYVVTGADTTTSLVTATGADLKLALSTSTADATISTKVTFTTSGCVTDVTTAKAVGSFTGGKTTALNGSNLIAKGNGYVDVTLIGLDSLDVTFTVTGTTTPVKLNTLGASGVANAATIALSGTPSSGVSGESAISATIANLDGKFGFNVSVTIGDKTFTKLITTTSATVIGTVTLDKNYDLNDATITVTEVVPKLAFESSVAGTTYTFTFNRDIAWATGKSGADVSVTAGTSSAQKLSAEIEGNKLIVVLDKALQTGEKISIDALASIVDAAAGCTANILATPVTVDLYTAP